MTALQRDSIWNKTERPPLLPRFDRWMQRYSRRLIPLIFVVLILSTLGQAQDSPIVHVPADFDTISAALEAVPDHAIIEIAEGDYLESLLIERPVTLRGTDINRVRLSGFDDEPVIQIVGTEDVLIEDLTIIGGKYGIFVTRSQDVTIRENVIFGSRLVGIKIRLAAAAILNNTVRDARPPYGKGIHVTNTTQWPASRIIGNTVSGNARSGIVTNMTGMIYIEDNIVTGNQAHGIAITEMSHALVADNIVDRNAENGIYIFDMSMASVCGNEVRNTAAAVIDGGIRYGNGILVDFYSEAEVHNNIVIGNANHGIQALFGSHIVASTNDVQRNGMNDLPRYTVYQTGDGSGISMCEEHYRQ